MTKLEKEYQEKYGDLSYDSDVLLQEFASKHKLDFDYLAQEEERIKNIPWEELEIVVPVVPKPSPRPRFNSVMKNVYVQGAKTTKKMIQKYIQADGIICTRIEFILDIYIPIPSSMTMHEKYLAEKGVIRPIQTPDFDNVAKTYSDALQSVLIINDNIINPGIVNKWYSFKPRVKILLRYQTQFDSSFNRKRIENSIAYLNKEKNDIRE